MNDIPFDANDEEIEQFADAMSDLMAWAAPAICGGASFAQFQQALRQNLPELMPDGILPQDAFEPGPEVQRTITGLAINLSYELWNATPQPANRFRPVKQARPERNSACPCGSGRKFKQCCGQFSSDELNIPPALMLVKVLDTWPRSRLGEVPLDNLAPADIALVVDAWLDEDRDEDALALLEALFADLARLDARAEAAADQLLQLYDDLGQPHRKNAFIARLKAAPDRVLRSTGLQREASILADDGDFDAAWHTFREAQRQTPDAPALSHLEVLILLTQGRRAEAVARCEFWCARLARDPENDYSDLIDILHSLVDDDPEALADLQRRQIPGVDRLATLLDRMPVPACHYRLAKGALLAAQAKLAKVEKAWNEFYDADASGLKFAEQVIRLLEREPLAWQSFHVLHDLLVVVRDWPDTMPGSMVPYVRRITARGDALRRCVLDALDARQAELAWRRVEHRPLLALAAVHAFALLDDAPEQAADLMAWLVLTADREDNQGLRLDFLHLCLQLGQLERARQVLACFPDDLPGIEYGRALTLHLAGSAAEATAALRNAHRRYPTIWKYLRPETIKAPKASPLVPGGDGDAWRYRDDFRRLWQDSGGLDWAAGILGPAGKSGAGN